MKSPIELFRPPLDRIIDLGHPLARLAGEINWEFLSERFGSVCKAGPGQPPLPTRLVAGLMILKHMHDLSDEVLCARWLENPYYQSFCGGAVFRHEVRFARSSMTRWRQRLGEAQLAALLQESLSVAHKRGVLATRDLVERVAVDTTVQSKAVAHPTDARPDAPGDRQAGDAGHARRGAVAPELRQGRQARFDHGRLSTFRASRRSSFERLMPSGAYAAN